MDKQLSNNATKVLLLCIITGSLSLAACSRKELSEAPERGTILLTPNTQESILTAKVVIPFSELAAQANKQAPTQFSKSGREHPCTRVGPKGDLPFGGSFDWTTEICTDVDYSINVRREGDISISRGTQPNIVRVTLPIKFDGQVGLTGFIAEATGLHRKNFDGAISARTDLSLDVGADWCPKIGVSTDFGWREKARIEIVSGVWIPIADQVSGNLRDTLTTVTNSVRESISCDRIKAEVAKVWVPMSFPVAVPTAGNVYVNVDPTGIGLSGLGVMDNRVEFALQVRAKVDVALSSLPSAVKLLPALERMPLVPGQITLLVPLRASYEPLVVGLSEAVKDKEFSSDTHAGKVSIKIESITVYPSKENLVVGVSFKADIPGRWLDTSGQVYLFGKPMVEPKGNLISLKNIQFARILDNDVWNRVSAVFETKIKKEIVRAATVDLSAPIAQAKTAITMEMEKLQPQSGVTIELNGQTLGIRQIVPAEKELFVEVSYQATAIAKINRK